MTDKRNGVGDYVKHVLESTQQYTRDILRENERLVGLATTLHEEKQQLAQTVVALEERLKRQDETHSSLLEQIVQLDATTKAFTARYLEVEQLNANLANLYVASYRIHGSLDRGQVLLTLEEILINLIGTEEFAVFEVDPASDAMRLASSFGVDAAQVIGPRLGKGRLGTAIARGAPYVPAFDPESTAVPRPVTVCVPLRVGDQVIGAIVVYRLLAHKPVLEESDMELFNLLATHGATALYCSTLHASRDAEARP